MPKDNATALVARAIPPPSEAQLDRIVSAAMHHVAGQGVSSVHDMGDRAHLAAYRRAHATGMPITRIHAHARVMVPGGTVVSEAE